MKIFAFFLCITALSSADFWESAYLKSYSIACKQMPFDSEHDEIFLPAFKAAYLFYRMGREDLILPQFQLIDKLIQKKIEYVSK